MNPAKDPLWLCVQYLNTGIFGIMRLKLCAFWFALRLYSLVNWMIIRIVRFSPLFNCNMILIDWAWQMTRKSRKQHLFTFLEPLYLSFFPPSLMASFWEVLSEIIPFRLAGLEICMEETGNAYSFIQKIRSDKDT